MLHPQNFRQVSGSAVGHRAQRWHVGRSSRSFTGHVVRALFTNHAHAAAFARSASARLGRSVSIRRYKGGWLVSVPVQARKVVS
jgi:hypothetical protein